MSLLAASLTAALLCYILFEDWDDFVAALKLWCQPDIISLFKGQCHEDQWTEVHLLLCLVISTFVGVCVYLKLN